MYMNRQSANACWINLHPKRYLSLQLPLSSETKILKDLSMCGQFHLTFLAPKKNMFFANNNFQNTEMACSEYAAHTHLTGFVVV